MSQTTLIEKIKAETADTVSKIKAEGKTKVEAIARETSEAIQAMQKEHELVEEKELSQMELVAVAKAKQAGKIALQEAKRNQIDSFFAELRKELVEQSFEDYVKFFVRHADQIIPSQLSATKAEAPVDRIKETEKILSKLNHSVSVSGSKDLTAGFVLHTEDGVYDVTLDRIINEKRPQIEMEMVQVVSK